MGFYIYLAFTGFRVEVCNGFYHAFQVIPIYFQRLHQLVVVFFGQVIHMMVDDLFGLLLFMGLFHFAQLNGEALFQASGTNPRAGQSFARYEGSFEFMFICLNLVEESKIIGNAF